MKYESKEAEKVFIVVCTIFVVMMVISSVIDGWHTNWTVLAVVAEMAVSWYIFLTNFKDYRTRSWILAVLMFVGELWYILQVDAFSTAIPPFVVGIIIVGLFNIPEMVYLDTGVFLFILGYHIFVSQTVLLETGRDVLLLLSQLLFVAAVEYLVWYMNTNNLAVSQQLWETIEALRNAEHSKDEFMANVSHEIRTPLNTICGMSELILREELDQTVREDAFHIQTAGRTLQAIVSDVLDFSELETGKISLNEEYYNFSSVMNDIINMAIAQNEEKNLEIIVDCDARIPCSMAGDSEKLTRVISGLVENAIKFTEKGCVRIAAWTRQEEYGVNLCVLVQDTGIGMDTETIEKLFTSFNQVDTRQNRRQGGIGLGIAIARKMVDLMHGFLSVRSEPGKGSEFQIVVPQKVRDERPMIVVNDKEEVHVISYINPEKYNMAEIRDNYFGLIEHLAAQLEVSLMPCRNLSECKRRMERGGFTHMFISADEYWEDPEYFRKISETVPLVMIMDRKDERNERMQGNFRQIYKPFYALSIANALNGGSMVQRVDGSHYLTNRFVAPEASILVVDDSIMNLKVMEGLLRPYEVRMFTATGGEEALRMLEWAHYDIIFMDHMMPRMDGVETLHEIRRRSGEYYKNVPVVALTANAIGGAREMFLAEGFGDFVAKPVELSNLERVLRKFLPASYIHQKDVWGKEGRGQNNTIETNKSQVATPIPEEAPVAQEPIEPNPIKSYLIDEEQGLMFCGGEMSDYQEILGIYYDSGMEKKKEIQALFEEKNWKEYGVLVHALKSTSQSIGANVLFTLAKEQEAAAKASEEEILQRAHEPLMQEYENVLAEIQERWGAGNVEG